MKLGNAEIVMSKEGKMDSLKVFEFLENFVGLNLVPVRGQYNSYWLSGKDGHDMIDGNKYYKLTLNDYGIEINCAGDYNAFSIKGSLIKWIQEGLKKVKKD